MSKKLDKYGKSLVSIAEIKDFLIEENDELREGDQEINDIYIRQPKRKFCKNCNSEIKKNDFHKQDIAYSICPICGHLNGLFEDTDQFCEAAYQGKGTEDYKKNYAEEDRLNYDKRVEDVYRPKAQFLIESLKKEREIDILSTSFCDVGAGLGYFINALLLEGQSNVIGYEVSKQNVDEANNILNKELVKYYEIEETLETIKNIDSEVVSMIGVLEHLQEPARVLSLLRDNDSVKYVYLSLPTFGPSVFFEMLSPETFHRQLSRDHTHLYTDQSIEWMCNTKGFKRVSEWWFGQDMLDLYRHILVHAKKKNGLSELASEEFKRTFIPIIDSLQLVLDKKKLSNEIHILLRKT